MTPANTETSSRSFSDMSPSRDESPRQVSEYRAREAAPARVPGPPGSFQLRQQLASVLGPYGGVVIWVGFSTLIVGALGAAYFGQRRSDRISAVISATERVLLDHKPLRARAGPVLAGGAYNVTIDRAGARGFYNAKTADGTHAKVFFTGVASGASWAFTDVRVEMKEEVITVTPPSPMS